MHGLNDEAKRRRSTRAYTRELVKRGEITKGPCEFCGTTERVEAHHPDYSDPRRVRWMCRPDHLAFHVEARRLAKVSAAAS